jgi:carbamoylphosphate synthase small subunit
MYSNTAVVNWLHASNIEVVLIPARLSASEIAAYFEYVHGLLVSPGWTSDAEYLRVIHTFLTMAVAANRTGDYFPVWGTCFGAQMLMKHLGGFDDLERFDSRDLKRSHIYLERGLMRSSRLLQYAPRDSITSPYFNHDFGVSVARFRSEARLVSAFRLLSTSHDRAGREYVSMVEGRTLPFYGTQFHPDESPRQQWMADFLHDELLKSRHTGFRPGTVRVRDSQCLQELQQSVPCKRTDF